MKIRKPLEVIGRDPEITLDLIHCLRLRAELKQKRKQFIDRIISPFVFLKGVVL